LLEPNAYKAKAKTRRDDSFMRLASAAKAIQMLILKLLQQICPNGSNSAHLCWSGRFPALP
jgi:hypothetical protein